MVPYLYIYRYTPMDNPLYLPYLLGDIIRETSRGCNTCTPGIYTYYLLVMVLSESILFMVLFWVLYHIILSPILVVYESLVIPEPSELAYGTSILLSLAGVSIGMVYTSRGVLGVYYWNPYYTLLASILFLVLQLGEFTVLGVYTNDSYTGTTYISISGLHLIHVSWGIGIVGLSSGTGYCMDTSPIDTIPMDTYSTLEYSYWHLVEMVYPGIYISLYYYSLVGPLGTGIFPSNTGMTRGVYGIQGARVLGDTTGSYRRTVISPIPREYIVWYLPGVIQGPSRDTAHAGWYLPSKEYCYLRTLVPYCIPTATLPPYLPTPTIHPCTHTLPYTLIPYPRVYSLVGVEGGVRV